MKKSNNSLSRRDFMLRSAIAGAGLGALGTLPDPMQSLAWAAKAESSVPSAKDRYFIFCYFAGGWDTLLSLDPRDPVKFNAGNLSVTHIEPGYEQLDDPPNGGKPYTVKDANGKPQLLGCYIGDLMKHLDKVSFVRGMSMDTLTHEVGRRRAPPPGWPGWRRGRRVARRRRRRQGRRAPPRRAAPRTRVPQAVQAARSAAGGP